MRKRFKGVPDKALATLDSARSNAAEGMRSLYKTAMNHPKTSSAVILGTGLAAALIWAIQRNGGFRKTQREVLARVREGYGTARDAIVDQTARFRGERQATLSE